MKIVLKDRFLSWFVGLFSPWMDPLIDPLPETHIVVGSLLYTTRFRFKTGFYFGQSKKEFLKFYQTSFVYELSGTAKFIFKMSSMYHTHAHVPTTKHIACQQPLEKPTTKNLPSTKYDSFPRLHWGCSLKKIPKMLILLSGANIAMWWFP